jgi:hypothetical protein
MVYLLEVGWLVPLILAFILASCTTTAPTEITPSATHAPTPDIVQPSPSPLPAPWVWLVEGADGVEDAVRNVLAEHSAADGLELTATDEVSSELMNFPPKIIVNLSDTSLAPDLPASFLETPLITIHPEDVERSTRSTLIDVRPALTHSAFAAGYTAAVVADNYRVAVVSLDAESFGATVTDAFSDGAIYYCGLCRPANPPFEQYPIFMRIPPNPEASLAASLADDLLARGVSLVYVAPVEELMPLMTELTDRGIKILADEASTEIPSEHLVAVIRPDLARAVSQVYPPALEGGGPSVLTVPLKVIPNPTLLSLARVRVVEQVLEDLQQGLIAVGSSQ